MNRNKIFKFLGIVVCLVGIMFTTIKTEAAQPSSQKSRVLLIVNNIAGTKHDDALTEIMNVELHKKIDTIYNEEDAEEFSAKFQGKSWVEVPLEELLPMLAESRSKYLVYAELVGIQKRTTYNFLYHGKVVNTLFYVRLVDLKNKSVIYATEYEVSASKKTDSFFVGSASVSKNALQTALFRAGEVISARLPL